MTSAMPLPELLPIRNPVGNVPPHPQVSGGILQHLHVVAFQEVRAGEGSVDGGTRIVGQAVSPDRVRRSLLQDCQSRFRA